jgi:hypothetical protein
VGLFFLFFFAFTVIPVLNTAPQMIWFLDSNLGLIDGLGRSTEKRPDNNAKNVPLHAFFFTLFFAGNIFPWLQRWMIVYLCLYQ